MVGVKEEILATINENFQVARTQLKEAYVSLIQFTADIDFLNFKLITIENKYNTKAAICASPQQGDGRTLQSAINSTYVIYNGLWNALGPSPNCRVEPTNLVSIFDEYNLTKKEYDENIAQKSNYENAIQIAKNGFQAMIDSAKTTLESMGMPVPDVESIFAEIKAEVLGPAPTQPTPIQELTVLPSESSLPPVIMAEKKAGINPMLIGAAALGALMLMRKQK